MGYQALYRKYRPSLLKDVVGQDIIIQTVKNSLKNNKIGHAYMFSGPRGTGKTTVAKIFSKAVNCEQTVDGDACGKCESCLTIQSSFCPDIIEIDAASNNGVDEIREIKNKINLVPSQFKYKVYIIDEVHMLSIGAFNALLKTLEEPPEHIIFILATTDLHKVPNTIISRCQCFEFGRIANKDLVGRIKNICDLEKITVDSKTLDGIAELSEGCLRDAISMLDKLNSFSNSNIKYTDFEKLNGIVSLDDKETFILNVYNGTARDVISFIDDIYDSGKDLVIFSQDLINICKDYCVDYYINDNLKYDVQFLLDMSSKINDIIADLKTSSNAKTIFEIAILSIINKYSRRSVNDNDYQSDSEVNNKLEEKVSTDNVDSKIIQSGEEPQISNTILSNIDDSDAYNIECNEQIVNNCFSRANKKNKIMVESKWNQLNDYALDSEYGAVACYVADGVVRVVGEEELIITFEYESMVSRGFSLIDKIKALFKKIYDIDYDIAFMTSNEWEQEKKNYITNMNDGIKYEYKPFIKEEHPDIKHKKSKKDIDSITEQAKQLFGDDLIINK